MQEYMSINSILGDSFNLAIFRIKNKLTLYLPICRFYYFSVGSFSFILFVVQIYGFYLKSFLIKDKTFVPIIRHLEQTNVSNTF